MLRVYSSQAWGPSLGFPAVSAARYSQVRLAHTEWLEYPICSAFQWDAQYSSHSRSWTWISSCTGEWWPCHHSCRSSPRRARGNSCCFRTNGTPWCRRHRLTLAPTDKGWASKYHLQSLSCRDCALSQCQRSLCYLWRVSGNLNGWVSWGCRWKS